MNRVEWTRSAISDLAGIYAYIAKDSERYATHVVDRITDRTCQIAEFPFSGEMVPEYQRKDIREIIEFSYRVLYLVEDSTIYILALIHGSALLPDDSPRKDR